MHIIGTGIFWVLVAFYFVARYVPPVLTVAFVVLAFALRRVRPLPRIAVFTIAMIALLTFLKSSH